MFQSNFEIVDVGQVAGSHRGIRQEIRPIVNGKLRRKLSGRAYSTARPQFNLFQTTIYFDDVHPPALAGLWPGQIVTIHCAARLPQALAIGEAPIRPQVPGTLIHLDAAGRQVAEGDPAAKFYNFCPILTGMVEPWAVMDAEWDAAAQSDITIQELEP